MNKVKKRVISVTMMIALSVSLAMQNAHPVTVQAKEPVKEESVSIKADATGAFYKVTAENRLSGMTGEEITDVSHLTDIRNRNGDEDYTADASGNIRWEYHGEDIRYEGDADKDALPFALHITYFLNGKEMKPEEIAGKSGEVRIRFTYENLTSGDDYVPFVFLTAALLEEDRFTEIAAEHGSVSRMDSYVIAGGMVFPGLKDALKLGAYEATEEIDLPEVFEITAKTDNFAMEFSVTIVMNGIFADLDVEDLKEVEEMIDDVDKLSDASGKLVSALSTLSNGAVTFRTALVAYTDAVSQIGEGIDALSSGLQTLNGSSGALQEGATQLSNGLSTLNDALSKINPSALTSGLSGAGTPDMSGLITDMATLGGAIGTELPAAIGGMTPAMAQLQALIDTEGDATKKAALQAVYDSFAATQGDLTISAGNIGTAYGNVTNDLTALSSGMDLSALQSALSSFASQITQLKEGISALSSGASQLAEGIGAYTSGVSQAASGASQIASALHTPVTMEGMADGESITLLTAGGTLLKGYDALSSGISSVRSGMQTFHEEAIGSISDLAGEELRDVLHAIRTVKAADDAYTTFSGADASYESSVRFIIETDSVKP